MGVFAWRCWDCLVRVIGGAVNKLWMLYAGFAVLFLVLSVATVLTGRPLWWIGLFLSSAIGCAVWAFLIRRMR